MNDITHNETKSEQKNTRSKTPYIERMSRGRPCCLGGIYHRHCPFSVLKFVNFITHRSARECWDARGEMGGSGSTRLGFLWRTSTNPSSSRCRLPISMGDTSVAAHWMDTVSGLSRPLPAGVEPTGSTPSLGLPWSSKQVRLFKRPFTFIDAVRIAIVIRF